MDKQISLNKTKQTLKSGFRDSKRPQIRISGLKEALMWDITKHSSSKHKQINTPHKAKQTLKSGFRDSKRLSCGTSQNTLHINTNKQTLLIKSNKLPYRD